MRQITRRKAAWFKARKQGQARKEFLEADLRQLGESLKARQLHPVWADLEGYLLTGERRVRGALLVGLDELDCVLTDENLTETEIRLIQAEENFHRAELRPAERLEACRELLALNPNWLAKDLAKHLKVDPSMVTRIMSPLKCLPAVQEAFAAGALGFSDTYAISRASNAEQLEMLQEKLGGASRDTLAKRVRRKKPNEVKVSRIKCELPGGITVVVSGKEISLEDFVDALLLAVKEAKAALKDKQDAKAFAAVMANRAKVG
jgi:ParB family transcriptional regulator, chromosome partitioning protein